MKEQSEYYIDNVGGKFWYLPSKGQTYWHREDGPAVKQADGTKQWWINNKRHRLDGPAVEYVTGSKEWWIDYERLPTREVETWLQKNNIDLKTEEGQMAFKLTWL